MTLLAGHVKPLSARQSPARHSIQGCMRDIPESDDPDPVTPQGRFLTGNLALVPRNPRGVLRERLLHGRSPLRLRIHSATHIELLEY